MLVALKYFCGAFALGVVVTLCGFGVMKVNEEYVPIAREYCESKARVFSEKKQLLERIEELESKIERGVVAEFITLN